MHVKCQFAEGLILSIYDIDSATCRPCVTCMEKQLFQIPLLMLGRYVEPSGNVSVCSGHGLHVVNSTCFLQKVALASAEFEERRTPSSMQSYIVRWHLTRQTSWCHMAG